MRPGVPTAGATPVSQGPSPIPYAQSPQGQMGQNSPMGNPVPSPVGGQRSGSLAPSPSSQVNIFKVFYMIKNMALLKPISMVLHTNNHSTKWLFFLKHNILSHTKMILILLGVKITATFRKLPIQQSRQKISFTEFCFQKRIFLL